MGSEDGMSITDVMKNGVTLFFTVSMILMGLYCVLPFDKWFDIGIYFIPAQWELWTFASFGGVIIGLIPLYIKRKYGIVTPWSLILAIYISIWIHTIGGVFDIYHTVPYFDKYTHFLSCAVLAFLAFTVTYLLNKHLESFKVNLWGMLIIMILFTSAMGVFWEFGQFFVDQFLGMKEQNDLFNTMTDLLADVAGAMIIAAWILVREKNGTIEKGIEEMDESIERFLKARA